MVGDGEQVCDGKWGFSFCGGAVIVFGPGKSLVNECRFSVVANIGKIWFELVANSGEI